MANKATANVETLWADANGRLARFSFNIELKTTALGNYDLNAMAGAIRQVVEKIDVLSECEFLGAILSFPIPFSTSGYKGQPAAESSCRRGAIAFFRGEPGENERAEIVSVLVPDPVEQALDKTGRIIRLNPSHGATFDFLAGFVDKALTSYGEAVLSYKGSIYRQRAVTKRSKQAA